MNKKIALLIVLFLLLTPACSFLTPSISESEPYVSSPKLFTPSPITPNSETFLPLPTPTSETVSECNPENWKLVVVSVDHIDWAGRNVVIVRVGIENNDSLWGRLSGPYETLGNVVLTTSNGSIYEEMPGIIPIPVDQSSSLSYYQNVFGAIGGWINTPLLPPGFVALGHTAYVANLYYGFAFDIPISETPELITIGGMSVDCILPQYGGTWISLPIETFNLNTDIVDIRSEPSALSYPDLVGSKLDLPDMGGVIEFTSATRNGIIVNISFNFTNSSLNELIPSHDGYIVGDGHIPYCQTTGECDHDGDPDLPIIGPGQTINDLTWSFTVPENENNLMFVYVAGDIKDTNKVYRINFE